MLDVVPFAEEDESPFAGLLVEAASRTREDDSVRMGCGAEVAASVGLGGEVTAVAAVAVEVDGPAALRALARSEIGAG